MKKIIVLTLLTLLALTCKETTNKDKVAVKTVVKKPKKIYEFGYLLNNYNVIRDTIREGETFGLILERNKVPYPRIFEIAEKIVDTFDVRKLQVGKPYTLLCAKDSTAMAQTFIYQPNEEDYLVIDFKDSIKAYSAKKPVKYEEKTISGILDNSISVYLDERGVSHKLAHKLADEIYAWTIDFRKLQKGDKFKVIYTDKYIDDTIYAGVQEVKAAYFYHRGDSLYAFKYVTDSVKGTINYFNEKAKNLRRAFLKMPVKFGRLSSRYNLKRRIAYYGYQIRPHKGTDFAAPIGTPIMATAAGTVIESTSKGGNGKYVKIKHNNTYTTQYLHMSRQNVRVGQTVRQGDIIGFIGMTGNTGGPHVCYRFWKNGVQVDPFLQKFPASEPIADHLKEKYLKHISPLKKQLDNISFSNNEKDNKSTNDIQNQTTSIQ